MTQSIDCAKPDEQYFLYKDEINAAILKVLDSGRYILGEEVALFEQEFAEYLGVNFAIGCGSGTDALVLALKALDIGLGDEVIVPSFTATPTVAAVVMTGATPVYVDIEADFFTLDPVCVKQACTDKTKAIIVVHLYGQAAAMDELMAIAKLQDLLVVEDCAQATGASYHGKKMGTIGDIGCFSFFPTKNLGAMGDGGAVVCNDVLLSERIQRLRQYGWDDNRISQEAGINSRLDELQASVLRVKLRYLDVGNEHRQLLASVYDELLAGFSLSLPKRRVDADHVFHLYVVGLENREALISCCKKNDIILRIHYPVPVHKMPAYYVDCGLPLTEKNADKIVSLPLFSGMFEESQKKIVTTIAVWDGNGQRN